MSTCAACEAEMDVDEFDVDRGDTLSCPECGANLEVVGVSPVELEMLSDDVDDGYEDRADQDTADGHGELDDEEEHELE